MTSQALAMELRRRQRLLGTLERKRDRHMAAAERIEAQIADFGGLATPGRRGPGRPRGTGGRSRPRNEVNLVEALAKVLSGKTMSVTEAAEAVQRSGYQTSSANFRTIVNQALIKSDRFKKVSRGQYTAK